MKLQRMDDLDGSTAGWWLVADVPGTLLYRSADGYWRLQIITDHGAPPPDELVRRHSLHRRDFATRREALEALRQARASEAGSPESGLGELL